MRKVIPVMLVGVAALAAGCAGEQAQTVKEAPTIVETKVVVPFAQCFVGESKPIVVKQDTTTNVATVVVVNTTQEEHSIVADDGSFNTGPKRPGEEIVVVTDRPGKHKYRCGFHDHERGVLEVKGEPTQESSPAPESTPPSIPQGVPSDSPSEVPTPEETPPVVEQPQGEPSPEPSPTDVDLGGLVTG